MIKLITMAKYKETANGHSKQKNILQAKRMSESLKGQIPTMKHVEVGINVLHLPYDYDVVSSFEYESVEDLKATIAHPAHSELITLLTELVEDNHVVTYDMTP